MIPIPYTVPASVNPRQNQYGRANDVTVASRRPIAVVTRTSPATPSFAFVSAVMLTATAAMAANNQRIE
jgi:hypothetical protein